MAKTKPKPELDETTAEATEAERAQAELDQRTEDGDEQEALASSGTIALSTKERLDLYEAAKQDHAAVKAARAAGQPIPATPALDELQRRHAMGTNRTTTRKSTSARTKTATDIRFYHDGKPMSDAQNKLSSVAWFHTRGIDAKHDRLGVSELVELLTKAGVKDARQPGWMVKLPNGITLEARKNGDKSEYKGDAKPSSTSTTLAKAIASKVPATKKSTAKKSTARKVSGPVKKQTPGAKARAATKPAAKAATRQVTPLPKKSTAKKSTRKSA